MTASAQMLGITLVALPISVFWFLLGLGLGAWLL